MRAKVLFRLLPLAALGVVLILAAGCAMPDFSLPEITPTPTAVAGTVTVAPTPIPIKRVTPGKIYESYTVQQGDTLWSISQQYGVDIDTLAEVNELEDVGAIVAGEQLLISDYVTVSGRYLPTPTPTPIPTATPRPCAQGCVYAMEGCDIKGLISRIDGTRLYVLPDDAFYLMRDADVWFCNEEDAVQSGWLHWTENGPATPVSSTATPQPQ